MKWSDLLASSFASLKQRPFRTALTVLGVTIGTMAVVVMVSLGVGMSSELIDGANDDKTLTQVTVTGSKAPSESDPKYKRMDASAIRELSSYEGVKEIIPTYSASMQVSIGRYEGSAQVIGIRASDMAKMNWDIAEGVAPRNSSTLQLLVGGRFDSYLWTKSGSSSYATDKAGESLVGKTLIGQITSGPDLSAFTSGITVDTSAAGSAFAEQNASAHPKKIPTYISGKIKPSEGFSMSDGASYAEMDALVKKMQEQNPGKPLPGQKSASAVPGKASFAYSSFILQMDSLDSAEQITETLRDNGWQAESALEFIKQMKKIAGFVQAIFGGIGAISLLVAAIGIANTMMMSVYERTKQIGIMKVLGASLKDIRNSFLVESASIGCLGGVVGLLISYTISWIMNSLVAATAQSDTAAKISIIPPWLAIFGLLFSTFIGTLAGWAPAQRAMKLSPLAAIRAE